MRTKICLDQPKTFNDSLTKNLLKNRNNCKNFLILPTQTKTFIMKHIQIKQKSRDQIIDLKLPLIDVTILYNACIDVIKKYPSMIGYRDAAVKLKQIIEQN
jgi:hypothetical protein